MKRCILLLLMAFVSGLLFGQAPQQLNYQAVLRHNDGSLMAEENVAVVVTILKSDLTTTVFEETHTLTTTARGLINLKIGSKEDLSLVQWDNDSYFLEVNVNGTSMGTSQLLSVPYALYAKTAATVQETFSLDEAYDSGGSGNGAIINADAGPVQIEGTGGLEVDEDITVNQDLEVAGTISALDLAVSKNITGDSLIAATAVSTLRLEADEKVLADSIQATEVDVEGTLTHSARRFSNHTIIPADGTWYNLFTGLNGHQMFEIVADFSSPTFHSLGHWICAQTYSHSYIDGNSTNYNGQIELRWTGTTYDMDLQIRYTEDRSPYTIDVYWSKLY